MHKKLALSFSLLLCLQSNSILASGFGDSVFFLIFYSAVLGYGCYEAGYKQGCACADGAHENCPQKTLTTETANIQNNINHECNRESINHV